MGITIGACGFSGTGSSAVCDFLKEFDENVVLDDFEFSLSYKPDGLEDLRYHLLEGSSKYTSSAAALYRFQQLCKRYGVRNFEKLSNYQFLRLSEKYREKLIQASWIGDGAGVDSILNPKRNFASRCARKIKFMKVIRKFELMLGHEIPIYPLHKIEYSAYPDDFDGITKEYVMGVLNSLGRDPSKNLVLDQPFSGNNPQASFPFFDQPKAIVVDRDPRDYYLFSKEVAYFKGRRYVPVNSVENFVIYYRNMRTGMPYLCENPNILRVNFEDMVYQYEKTKKRIIEFCQLKEYSRPRSIFEPNLSRNNTQLSLRYPEYATEIKYIETELPEYLYPFDKYSDQKFERGEMFFGRSPLNKRKRNYISSSR